VIGEYLDARGAALQVHGALHGDGGGASGFIQEREDF
jgi:hypothetical protein